MKLFKIGSLFTITILFANLDSGLCGAFIPVIIPVIISLGGAVICNVLGCYGYRKLEGFNRSLRSAECDILDYEVDLIIDKHLVMGLMPSTEANEAGCFPYLIHANVTDDKMYKEVIEVESKAILYESLITPRSKFYLLESIH